MKAILATVAFALGAMALAAINAAWQADQVTLAQSHKPDIKLISIQHQDCVAVLTSNREVVFQPRTTRADGSIDCYLEDVK